MTGLSSSRVRRLVGHLVPVGTCALLLAAAFPAPPAAAATPLAGVAGIDNGLPPTPSAVTLKGRDRFAQLSVTVSQTTNLVNQAVSVSWTGAAPGTDLANNFMQIFQCWGDDDGTNPANPGPPPEKCEFGGEPVSSSVLKFIPAGTTPSLVYSRAISQASWGTPWFDKAAGFYDAGSAKVWRPFQSVDGKVVNAQITAIKPACDACLDFGWQNPYFKFDTTNEQPWGRTYADGTGSQLFQVATGLEASGLGCGQKKEVRPDGSTVVPKCWLVVVPRGSAAEENPPPLAPPGYEYVATSPLSPAAWANRIAFPLSFNPVDSACALGTDEQRIVGNQMAISAVSSWQPKLCSGTGGQPYAYSSVADDQARQQVISRSANAPGLAVVNRPYSTDVIDPDDPVVYAPLTLSGLVVAFNLERVPTDLNGRVVEPAERDIAGRRVTNVNLTPRLVAKLLTQSYSAPYLGAHPASYSWLTGQPFDISADPDFVQFNPEFAVMTVGTRRTTSAVTVEASSSDAAQAVWAWILADPEAKAWLDGAPDPWGMKVNPLYTTNGAKNPTGQPFGDPLPNLYPKNDPYCYKDPGFEGIVPRPLCLLDVQPFALSMAAAAQATQSANDGAQTTHDALNGTQRSPNTWWGADGPQRVGAKSILSITDSASAVRYGLPAAHLSRAGDDGAGRRFIAPDTAGLVAGVKGMISQGDTGVLVPDPTAKVADAYPLTLLTYAAAFPNSLDQASRTAYADFVRFAVNDGQTPGLEFGQLPPGYAPLPADLKAQAVKVEAKIRSGVAVSTSTTESSTSTTDAVVGNPIGSGGGGGGGITSGDPSSSTDTTVASPGSDSPTTTVPGSTTTTSAPARPASSPGLTPLLTAGSARLAILGALVLASGSAAGVLALDGNGRQALRRRLGDWRSLLNRTDQPNRPLT